MGGYKLEEISLKTNKSISKKKINSYLKITKHTAALIRLFTQRL